MGTTITVCNKNSNKEYSILIPDDNIISQRQTYKISDNFSCERIDLFITDEPINILDIIKNPNIWTVSEESLYLIEKRIRNVCDFYKKYFSDYKFMTNDILSFIEFIPGIEKLPIITKRCFVNEYLKTKPYLHYYIRYTYNLDDTTNEDYKNILNLIYKSINDMSDDAFVLNLISPPSAKMPVIDCIKDFLKASELSYKFKDVFQKNLIWFDSEPKKKDLLQLTGVYEPISLKYIAVSNFC